VADFGVLKEWQAPHDIIYSCSSDRQILVLFQTKNYLELYDVDTGMKRDLKIRNHASVAAYSRYGFHLAVGEYSCTKGWINLINPATAKSYKHFEAHVGRLSGIAWSSLDFMISSGSDGYIKVWDSRDGACLFLSNLDSHGLWTLHFNCSSMLAYVATSNGCLECWEITNIKGLEDSTEMELNVAATQLQRIYKGKKTREIMRIFRSNQNE
jgi:WD40 repeat protein